VVVRLSDFKSDEYAQLEGGEDYEPDEANPMLGFRGASRYYDDEFTKAFELECKALRKCVDELGLDNLTVMVPFCRTMEEARKVRAKMKEYGLDRQGDIDVYGHGRDTGQYPAGRGVRRDIRWVLGRNQRPYPVDSRSR